MTDQSTTDATSGILRPETQGQPRATSMEAFIAVSIGSESAAATGIWRCGSRREPGPIVFTIYFTRSARGGGGAVLTAHHWCRSSASSSTSGWVLVSAADFLYGACLTWANLAFSPGEKVNW